MNFNGNFPFDKPRILSLSYDEDWGSIACDSCHYFIENCHLFSKIYPNEPPSRGPSDRHKVLTSNAAQILKPFSFLRGMSCVTYDRMLPDNAGELCNAIMDPRKVVDLFPPYWATLFRIPRVPQDDYTQKMGRMWLETEDNLRDDPVGQGGAEADQYEFCMGPATAYWTWPEWLLARVRMLRCSMKAGDEAKYHRRSSAFRCFFSSVLRDLQDRMIYIFEDLRPPPEDVEDEKGWVVPEIPTPESP